MKDHSALLDLMIREYENSSGFSLSAHDPVFHTFNAVAHVGDILSIYQDKEARERYILTAKRRTSVLAHAIAYGYYPRKLEPDRHTQELVFADAIPEPFTVYKGQQVRTMIEDGQYTVAEVLNDVDVPRDSLTATVEIEVGLTTEKVLGNGNGTQLAFPIEGDYVYIDSMYLRVITPLGEERWTRVDDFLESESTDNHFIVDVGAMNYNDMMRPNDLMLYVRCGNGISGRVFPEDSQIIAVFKQVNPYQDTMPLGVFTVWETPIPYLKSTSNIAVLKEKVLPEDIEILRRNAIYSESIGKTLMSKIDFERAVIVQSIDKISKSYATGQIVDGKNIYTIYVAGDSLLTADDLTEIRDKMYDNYYRNFNDEYQLVQAPTLAGTIELSVIFDEDMSISEQDDKIYQIKDLLYTYVKSLDLGETYSIPEMWKQVIALTSTDLKGLEYIQFTSVPPTLTPEQELTVDIASIVVTNNTVAPS